MNIELGPSTYQLIGTLRYFQPGTFMKKNVSRVSRNNRLCGHALGSLPQIARGGGIAGLCGEFMFKY